MTGTAIGDDTPVIALKMPASKSLSETVQARFDVCDLKGIGFTGCSLGFNRELLFLERENTGPHQLHCIVSRLLEFGQIITLGVLRFNIIDPAIGFVPQLPELGIGQRLVIVNTRQPYIQVAVGSG